MGIEFSWYFLLPVFLVLLYGCTQRSSFAALGFHMQINPLNSMIVSLGEAVFIVAWLCTGFPLPVFYALAYCVQAASLFIRRNSHMKAWFLLNINFVNKMVLHLTFVGVAALLQGISMHSLLTNVLWRTLSLTFVLAICLAEDLVFLRLPGFAAVFAVESESQEAHPFMAFLWFCTAYLLADSLLCAVELTPLYPPLFLIGSCAVLMFFIIRFLLHIYAIIREEHLREEHDMLSSQLAAARESGDALRRMTDRDALTGVYSRRYIMEKIQALMKEDILFSLVFLDLDGLKKLNDREGHDAGDRCLIRFSREVGSRLSEGELLARVGGDEFIVLMPGREAEEAYRLIEDIRNELKNFSYGVTGHPPGTREDAGALIRAADQAMYQDKLNRR